MQGKLSFRGQSALFAIAIATSGTAFAQDGAVSQPADAAVDAGAAPTSSAAGPASDGEIVVTANKREQRLQDVGLSVSALSGEALATKRINNVADLAMAVPGLNFSQSPESKPVYTLRGVGFYESSLAAYPDVATYIDQVPLPLPILSALTGFDLERVEVLKGPQGTLFGNNATGGAINFVAARPTNEFSAGLTLGYARFNTVEAGGYVSGPLTDTLNARFAFKTVQGDGWQRSYTRPGDTSGKTDTVAGRLLLDWKPTDRLTVSINLNAWRDQSDPIAPQIQKIELQNPVGTCGFGGCIGPDMPFRNAELAPKGKIRAADWNPDHDPYADNKFKQAAARIDYELAEAVTLTSISSYIDFDMQMGTEGGGTFYEDLDVFNNPGSIKTFSQELRLQGGGQGLPVRWTVGANYENTKTYEIFDTHYRDHSSGYQQGFTAARSTSDQRMKNYAVFANLEWDVVDLVTLKGGLRYTEARRKAALETKQVPGDIETPAQPGFSNIGITNFFNFVWANLYTPITCPGVTYAPIAEGTSISIDPTNCQAGLFKDTLKEHNTSWSVGADFKPIEDLLIYTNVSKGYKSGSYPIAGAATFAQYAPVTQESLLNYEVGFKSTLADGKLIINGAAFYYDYKDKQLRAKIIDPIFGPLDGLVNVPKSTIRGAEAEIVARPMRGMNFSFAATYLDAKVKKYNGVIGSSVENGLRVPILGDFGGVRLPFAPKWQINVAADYEFPVTDDWNMFLGANLSAQTKTIGTLKLSPAENEEYKIIGRALLDLNAGVSSADRRWRVTVWGKNVTGKYYWINTVQSYDTVVRYPGRPSEYGLTVALKY